MLGERCKVPALEGAFVEMERGVYLRDIWGITHIELHDQLNMGVGDGVESIKDNS